MRPVRITVSELFGEYDYEIPLHEGITYIHSPNGMGKSTVMKMLRDMFDGDARSLAEVPFKKIKAVMDDGSELMAIKDSDEVTIEIVRNMIAEEVGPDDLRDMISCTYIGPERLYIPTADGHSESAFLKTLNRLSESIRNAMADDAIPTVPGEDIPDGDLERRFKDIGARLDFIKRIGIVPKIPLGFKFPPTRYDITQNQAGYNGLARSLSAWCDKYYGFAESVVVFRDIVNSIFINKSISFNDNGNMEARMDSSGTAIPVEKFSSGERHVVIMFYSLLFETKAG